ncbi:hypothetical protein ET445_09930 [Agromyces protaetiae]|uniref:DUF1440 domain-containing protein n=1 Tax=Agromyces protaetiae TaxID=2509455 RepID=A0A4V0YH63_9MICO|nr:hypothetical protein [Agromyces protaetiae]QAY73611.1 hypothetical protein ET445_09930 [Agromyces protaetiae]
MSLIRSLATGVAAGAVAGAAGTIAMDAVWYRRYRKGGGRARFTRWEFADDVTTWDDASAPGQVGRKALELLTGETPPDSWARPATNAVHWATGVGWGAVFGLAGAVVSRATASYATASRTGGTRAIAARVALAASLGPAAWLTSYATLPLLGVYRPIWKYDAGTLGKDLSAHLVFGLVTASTHALLTWRKR